MEDARTTAVGFMTFAKSYLDTALHIARSIESGELRLSHDAPVFALFAHALELQLKSALIAQGTTTSAAAGFGHDIASLFAACKKLEGGSVSIAAVEKSVRNRWRVYLRDARDAHQGRISAWVGTSDPDILKEFGVFDNEDIGHRLPELRHAIQWLSDRHADVGSHFRYLKTGPDWHPQITAFGLREHVPLRTIQWACEEMDLALREGFFPRHTKRPGHC